MNKKSSGLSDRDERMSADPHFGQVRRDAPMAFVIPLNGREPQFQPLWPGSPQHHMAEKAEQQDYEQHDK